MLSSEIRKRLARLNRPAAPPSLPTPAVAPPFAPPDADFRVISVPDADWTDSHRPPGIADVTPGRAVERAEGGAYWLIERRLTDIAPFSGSFIRRYGGLLASDAVILPEGAGIHLAEMVGCDPQRVLYLDIETTGLCGCPLFLIGVMQYSGEDFSLRQYFARNYAEERHVLADLAEALPGFDLLVTFNGRRFDVPYVRDRATVHRLEVGWPPRHFDLLHESRRRWRGWFPNCRLTTLEEFICRRRRVDDIPGAFIPAAYHRYVHTDDATEMRRVIHHNALDLVTMAELVLCMLVGEKDWD